MEPDLALAARRAVASLSVPTEWLTSKAAVSMTTPLLTCACILNFLHPSPRWNFTCAHGWQFLGGGLYIEGTATLTNTNVYDNQAHVCWPVETVLVSSHPAPHWC